MSVNSGKNTSKPNYMKQLMKPVSFTLVLALLFSTVVTAMATTIDVERPESATDASLGYLIDNFDYFGKNKLGRMGEFLEQKVTNEDSTEDYYKLAAYEISKGKYNDALKSIDKCIELYDGGEDEMYLDLIMKQGCLYVMIGDYANALKRMKQAQKLAPNNTDVLLVIAQIYANQKDYSNLAKALDSYLKIKPQDEEIRALLAQARFLEENYQAANLEYGKILENGNDPKMLYLYGLTAIQNSAYEDGEKSLDKCIELNDSFEGVYYYRGVCRMSIGKYAEAVSDMTVSIERGDLKEASYYTRAVCSLMTDNYNYDQVVADLTAAMNGDDSTIKAQASDLLQKLNEAVEAALKSAEGTTEGAIEALKETEELTSEK